MWDRWDRWDLWDMSVGETDYFLVMFNLHTDSLFIVICIEYI